MSEFTREIRLSPAWDKRNADPGKDYGVHGVELQMYLRHARGTVQFVIYTGWMLPHVTDETTRRILLRAHARCLTIADLRVAYRPMPADRGYHSPVPQFEGQEPIGSDCEFTGGVCYYDGSGLAAEKLYSLLVERGSAAVWEELEKYWNETFA